MLINNRKERCSSKEAKDLIKNKPPFNIQKAIIIIIIKISLKMKIKSN